jgi:hypothetical protein
VTYNVKNTSKSTGTYTVVYLSTDQTISTAGQLLNAGSFSLAGDDAQCTTAAITLSAPITAGRTILA